MPACRRWQGRKCPSCCSIPTCKATTSAQSTRCPWASNLTIDRTVSLEGDTLELHLSLPLYDAEGGEVALRYDRTRGDGDLPDDNTITLESGLRAIALTYQEYSSMTGVRVIQGSLTSEPRGADAFTVEDGAPTRGAKRRWRCPSASSRRKAKPRTMSCATSTPTTPRCAWKARARATRM